MASYRDIRSKQFPFYAVTLFAVGVFVFLSLKPCQSLAYIPISDEQLFEVTPLMTAVSKGDIGEVKRLLDSGVNPNARSKSGGTALMVAARSGRVELVHLLLAKGADPNNCGEEDYCPLWYAADANSLSVVKLLVKAGADPKWVPVDNGTEYPPLQLAVYHRNLPMVKFLVEAGADMEFTRYWSNFSAPTPLAIAVAEGYPDIVKYLLQHGARIYEATEVAYEGDDSALAYSRDKGHAAVVAYIKSVLTSGKYTPAFTLRSFIDRLYRDPKYRLSEESPKAREFLARVSMDNLRLMRNSIFARKHYRFKDTALRDYFTAHFSDYSGNTRQVTLSAIDKENVKFIKSLEKSAYHRSIAS